MINFLLFPFKVFLLFLYDVCVTVLNLLFLLFNMHFFHFFIHFLSYQIFCKLFQIVSILCDNCRVLNLWLVCGIFGIDLCAVRLRFSLGMAFRRNVGLFWNVFFDCFSLIDFTNNFYFLFRFLCRLIRMILSDIQNIILFALNWPDRTILRLI